MSVLALAGQVSLGVCLQLASAAESTPVFVPVQAFTLAWDHSIEKVRWEEDYDVLLSEQAASALKSDYQGQLVESEDNVVAKQPVLVAKAARIRGSGAGMEPPEDAVFKEGWYHYTPLIVEHQELRLTRSEFVPDYEWCDVDGCRSLSELLPRDGDVTLMWACDSQKVKVF